MEAFEALGAAVWAISPSPAEDLEKMKAREGLSIPQLLDPELETVARYGALNEGRGDVPHPTVVIVDAEGIVRFVHLDENYRRRPPASRLLDALREIVEAAPAAPGEADGDAVGGGISSSATSRSLPRT